MLKIKNLSARIGETQLLDNVDLQVASGEIVGLVGESGSGKSLTALSVMQLVAPTIELSGSVQLEGQEVMGLPDKAMAAIRGRDVGMIFQEPMTSLNPVMRIGDQVAEMFRLHRGLNRGEAAVQASIMLDRVGLDAARVPRNRYPHQLSGGQRQRVMIAMAIALHPKLLIADEPTTALDVTVQAEVLALLNRLAREEDMGLLLISHDLAVVAENADRVVIMKNGRIEERGPTLQIVRQPKADYTKALIEASSHVPKRAQMQTPASSDEAPLLRVDNLVRSYVQGVALPWREAKRTIAVNGVSFEIQHGQSLGLVGESGCGKSTLARSILGLEAPDSGKVLFEGHDIYSGHAHALPKVRRNLQIVFQDPYGSFNPRHRAGRIIAEPLHLTGEDHARDRAERVAEALREVHLSPDDAAKYPHEFSGGQRQRLAIARALITRPKLIIADEPVSALDVSIRAQILDLIAELRDRLGLAYLFISHDLSVVRAITDDCLVMNAGQIVERGPTGEVFDHPAEAYTQRLVAAAPRLDRIIAA